MYGELGLKEERLRWDYRGIRTLSVVCGPASPSVSNKARRDVSEWLCT